MLIRGNNNMVTPTGIMMWEYYCKRAHYSCYKSGHEKKAHKYIYVYIFILYKRKLKNKKPMKNDSYFMYDVIITFFMYLQML